VVSWSLFDAISSNVFFMIFHLLMMDLSLRSEKGYAG
jgi:hypothetical protein